MILEGFTVENWSCIRRAVVETLPSSGVIVLHAPNRTGKSSLIAALRAALFDFQPTSTREELKRFFPLWDSDPPRVSVRFRVAGQSYRVTKQFKKAGDCRLESQSGTSWTTVTKTPAEVHDQTLALVGGKKSVQGLQQLLWLEQADFQLPDEKNLDADVQARLRNVLGVMQTPVDDAFLNKLKKKWTEWHTGSKPGPKTKRKEGSDLAKDMERLSRARQTHDALEAEFRKNEGALTRAEYLEFESKGLKQSQAELADVLEKLQTACDQLQGRQQAFSQAQSRLDEADRKVVDARKELTHRQVLESQLQTKEEAVESAKQTVEKSNWALSEGRSARDDIRRKIDDQRNAIRKARIELAAVQAHVNLIQKRKNFESLRLKLQQVQDISIQLDELDRLDRENPALPDSKLNELINNRNAASKLQADLNAAAMMLTLTPDPGRTATVVVDDRSATEETQSGELSVRRRAVIAIPNWGRIAVSRGIGAGNLDADEQTLAGLDSAFRNGVALCGFSGHEPEVLDQLRNRVAKRKVRDRDRTRLQKSLNQLGTIDVTVLQDELKREETALAVLESEPAPTPVADPTTRAVEFQDAIDALELSLSNFEDDEKKATATLDGSTEDENATSKSLTGQANKAQQDLANALATTRATRNELERLPTADTLSGNVSRAGQEYEQARQALTEAGLSEDEQTLPERLRLAKGSAEQSAQRLADVLKELHLLQGALSKSEGLHQKRAEAAALVEVLERQTAREDREARAFNRLYELFEECRDRQFATVTAPITERVLRWMRLVGIDSYRDIECNDYFLPQKLIGADGKYSQSLEHESTGAREMIGLMTRLALAAVLVRPGEPAVAVLDDPLTHCDPLRIDRMKAVLKSAAAGEPSANPAAGPLQILTFTCHPDRFLSDAAAVIDLGNPAIVCRA